MFICDLFHGLWRYRVKCGRLRIAQMLLPGLSAFSAMITASSGQFSDVQRLLVQQVGPSDGSLRPFAVAVGRSDGSTRETVFLSHEDLIKTWLYVKYLQRSENGDYNQRNFSISAISNDNQSDTALLSRRKFGSVIHLIRQNLHEEAKSTDEWLMAVEELMAEN